MELNAEQIKKALECCVTDSCFSCPYDDVGVYSQCVPDLLKDALTLINSQEQRIKELTAEYDSMAKSVIEADELIRKLRADKKELTEENEKDAERIKTECLEKIELDVKAIQADTVRKMQERLREKAFSIPTVYNSYFGRMIDQIAKEMLDEGSK